MIATVSLRRMWLREVVEGILFRNRSDSLFLKHDENNNDKNMKTRSIHSIRGRADWSYWRIDYWKQWSLAFVFRNTIVLCNTCNEGQIGRPHSPRWIAQWTEWLCSCPSPILMGHMSCPSPSRHTEGDGRLDWFHFIHWNGALEGRNHDCQQTVVGDYVSNRIVMANEEYIQSSKVALEWKQHDFVFW